MSNRWKYPLAALAFTLLAFPVMSLLVLSPFEHAADFALSDFYTRAEQRQQTVRASRDIVMVSVDDLGREEIVHTVKAVSDAGAAVTAVDIFMTVPREGDDALARILDSCQGLVLPCTLTEEFPYSVYGSVSPDATGYTNLDAASTANIIRRFQACSDGKLSFPAAAASLYAHVPLDEKEHLITFTGTEFEEITPEEILEDPGCVEGKIAILGDVRNFSDVHETPLGPMAGSYIQAHILQTILDGSAKKETPRWFTSGLAFLLCFLLFWGHLYLKYVKKKESLVTLLMYGLQFVLLIAIYLLGALAFIHWNRYADLSIVLAVLGTESMLISITVSTYRLITKSKKK